MFEKFCYFSYSRPDKVIKGIQVEEIDQLHIHISKPYDSSVQNTSDSY